MKGLDIWALLRRVAARVLTSEQEVAGQEERRPRGPHRAVCLSVDKAPVEFIIISLPFVCRTTIGVALQIR